MRLISLALAGAVVIAAPVAAQAAPRPDAGPETVNVVVSTKGLDLTSQKAARRLLRRLARAASAACGESEAESPLLPPDVRRDYRRCRADALADVVARSNIPELQRQYAATREGQRLRLARR